MYIKYFIWITHRLISLKTIIYYFQCLLIDSSVLHIEQAHKKGFFFSKISLILEENLSNYNASNITDARKIQSAKALEITDELMLAPHLFYQVIKTVNVFLGWGKLSANSQIHKYRVFMFK